MHRPIASIAAAAAIALTGATSQALAGDWRHHDNHAYAGAPWYDQHPWIGTGVGLYYSQHPDHVPGYPRPLEGYAVPIYEVTTARPAPTARRYYGADAHVEWCAQRYRSYDFQTDTYQPFDGPRQYCRSPFG